MSADRFKALVAQQPSQLKKMAVDLLDAGVDGEGCTIERRSIDQKGWRGMDFGLALHLVERSVLGLNVFDIADLLQVCLK